MILVTLLLIFCAAATLLLVAISRSPLLRTLMLSFDGWAETARIESGRLN